MRLQWSGAVIILAAGAVSRAGGLFGGNASVMSAAGNAPPVYQNAPQFPASGTVSATASDGSTVDTAFDVQGAAITLTLDHLLSGSAGSQVQSRVLGTIGPLADLRVGASAEYKVLRKLWTGAPPALSADIRIDGVFNGEIYPPDAGAVEFVEPYGLMFSGRPDTIDETFSARSMQPGGAAELTGTETISFALLGDLDGDRRVGFSDLLTLVQHYGATGAAATYANGDINEDGNIGFADVLALAQHYGEDFTDKPMVTAVPEPAAIEALLPFVLALRRGRK